MSMYSPSGSDSVHVNQVLPSVSIGWPNMPYEIKMINGKHCVCKKGTTTSLGCHDSHDGAVNQLKALYAQEGGKMGESASFLINLDAVQLSEAETTKWVHALPLGSYSHPVFGPINIDQDRVKRFADNVKAKVRGIDPSINYNHDNNDKDGASGWVKDAEARSNGLWLFVDFVVDAAEKIRQKKFKYFSIEFVDEWIDAQGKKFQDVVLGGALTNRPFMKNLVPINLSEDVITMAFDLVGAINTGKAENEGKETHMTEDEIKKIIEGVTKNLSESLVPKVTPQNDPAPNPVKSLEEVEELKKLAEDNPLVAKLFQHFEAQAVQLTESAKNMRETLVNTKLAEFENSKLVLTPKAKELAKKLALKLDEAAQAEFWELMETVKSSNTFLVELGQRSGASITAGFSSSGKTATQLFMDSANAIVAAEGIPFLEAFAKAAKNDPELYKRYSLGEGAPADASGIKAFAETTKK